MNKKLFKMLCDNYGRNVSVELYEMFDEELKMYDPMLVKGAIKKILSNNKYFPTLSEIKEVIRELPPLIISEDEKIKRWKAKGIVPAWLQNEKG